MGTIKNIWDLDFDRSAWHVEDNIWMKERKKQWGLIKPNIDELLVSSRKMDKSDIKYLKSYFLTGEISELGSNYNLLVLIWLHPSSDVEDWKQIKVAADELTQNSMERLFYKPALFLLQEVPRRLNEAPTRTEGFFGKRYYPIYDFLVNDNSGKWDSNHGVMTIKQGFIKYPISNTIKHFIMQSRDFVNIHDLSLSLVDEWHQRLLSEKSNSESSEKLSELFYCVLKYGSYAQDTKVNSLEDVTKKLRNNIGSEIYRAISYTTEGRDGPLQRKLANRVLEILESGDCTDDVRVLWEKCKSNYIKWRTSYECYYYDAYESEARKADDSLKFPEYNSTDSVIDPREEIDILINDSQCLQFGIEKMFNLAEAEKRAIAIHQLSKCDLNKKYNDSWIIDEALSSCSYSFVEYLLSEGVVFRRGDYALTDVMDLGCSEENRSIKLLQLAESNGYEITAKRANILLAALCKPFQISDIKLKNEINKCIQFLIDRGGNLNTVSKSWYAQTPLIAAVCSRPNVDMVQLLLDFGAEINFVDDKGFTPLFYACGKPAEEGTVLLKGYEPKELVSTIEFLIKNGADTKKKVGSTQTPLYWAKRSKYAKIQKLLTELS